MAEMTKSDGAGVTLLCFGYGFSAQALAARLQPRGARIIGTTRDEAKAERMRAQGVEPLIAAAEDPASALTTATHLLVSAGPDEAGDPTLAWCAELIEAQASRLAWVGYLSTTGVYGDHAGGWIDESAPRAPSTRRGRWRVQAEDEWLNAHRACGLPLHIFRLAGIYGAGRGPFAKLRGGAARRIVKPGQVFSRIHVEDIASVLEASIARPNAGATYNVCDDEPAPPQDVIGYAAELLGLPPPPETPFDEAKKDMSPMAVSFYAESKRVSNARIKQELGVTLRYPTYREGLRAEIEAET